MFTGLIEAVGRVESLRLGGGGGRLEIGVVWPDGDAPARGDSVAVAGACLTVVASGPGGFAAELSEETLRRTRLGRLVRGDAVNLERALRMGDRLGGHLVQGHVDAVVRVLTVHRRGRWSTVRVELPPALAPEVVEKGSVALDGVSLTVAALADGWFEVALIPETLAATTLATLRRGDELHLETDILGKYVARRISFARAASPLEELFGADDAAD